MVASNEPYGGRKSDRVPADRVMRSAAVEFARLRGLGEGAERGVALGVRPSENPASTSARTTSVCAATARPTRKNVAGTRSVTR